MPNIKRRTVVLMVGLRPLITWPSFVAEQSMSILFFFLVKNVTLRQVSLHLLQLPSASHHSIREPYSNVYHTDDARQP